MVSIAKSNVPTVPCVFREWTETSEIPAAFEGVPMAVPDAAPVPNKLVAETVHEYGVPLVNIVTAIGEEFPLAEMPPQLAV